MPYKAKPKKIRRRGPSVFRKGNGKKILKYLGYGVLAAVVIASGYFLPQMIKNSGPDSSSASSSSAATQTTTPSDSSQQTTTTTAPPVVTGEGTLRAFYLPLAQLTDTAALQPKLEQAAAAGFNAVVFDLKDATGNLHYVSATPLAVQSKAITADAVSIDKLKAALDFLKEKGFTAIPRLYAFEDHTAPFALESAKITLKEYPTYTWLDNSKEKGGKPWLNPYSVDAHAYITELAKELSNTGFTVLMLDGVQFPNQTSQAYYGESALTSLSQSDVLKKFITDLSAAVGDHCRVLQTMPGLSAFREATDAFGGNPVTFGSDTVCPVLMPSTLGSKLSVGETTVSDPASSPYDAVRLAATQVNLRLELIDRQTRPILMPWLQGYDYSSAQMLQQIQAITEALGDEASYILYNADGSYDFSALKP